MGDGKENANVALTMMQEWLWQYCDPDGVPLTKSMDLSLVLSRLAMDGLPRPQNAVLRLLCQGDLIATGTYYWRKYEFGEVYQLEESDALIKRNRWQTLADLIADKKRMVAERKFHNKEVDLIRLGLNNCDIFQWDHSQNSFRTAVVPDDALPIDSNYFEEWYSACYICVMPRELPNTKEYDDSIPDVNPINKGGRPPIADWEAAALEMAGRYYKGDFKPKTVADVVRELAAWLGEQNKHPSDSVLRDHAKPIFEAFQAWESE